MTVADYILDWSSKDPASRAYAEGHLKRLEKTLAITPPAADAADRVLEMGAYFHITPALKSLLGYGEVRGCYYGPRGIIERKSVTSASGDIFECCVDLFDAERDPFPYPDEHFATVLCCELLEHLSCDPMHMMHEINRVLKVDGHLVLTTPNLGSLRAIAAILTGYNPGFFPAYLRPSEGGAAEARHSREYTMPEACRLLLDSGFEVTFRDTGPYDKEPGSEFDWVKALLEPHQLSTEFRGECIFAVGRKTGPPRERYPCWLYSG